MGDVGGVPLTETEKLGVLIAAVSTSAVISLIDFIIGEVKEQKEDQAVIHHEQ
jgi:hypothetical protein